MESTNNSGEMKQQTEVTSQAMAKSKRSYRTPILREWGSVAGLTLTGILIAIPELYTGSLAG